MDEIKIAGLNGVTVLRRADGKFGIRDERAGMTSWRYSNETGAMRTATAMAAENDRIDAHVARHAPEVAR